MYFVSFALLFLAITSVLYGTVEVWTKSEYDQSSANVQLAEIKGPLRFSGSGKVGGIADDLISSPPDRN